MARKQQRSQRPLVDLLRQRAPEYVEGLIVRVEVSSVLNPTPIVLASHNVQDFELDLRSGGFSGSLSVLVSDDSELRSTERDKLITIFRAPDLLKLRLTLQAKLLDQDVNTLPPPLELQALVIERALEEEIAKLGNDQLSFRRYFFRFADAAQVLWRQHFPCELFTQKSLRDVLEAHRNLHIAIEYPDPALSTVLPMIFLGCDVEHRSAERASFYDLVMWRLDELGKVWMYDYTRRVYQIQATKPRPVAIDLIPHDLERIYTYFPEYPRHQKNVLNDFVEATANQLLDNPKKVNFVRQDHLFNTEIRSRFDNEVTVRTKAFSMPRPEFMVCYRHFPSKPFAPNVGIDFKADILDLAAEDIAIPFEAATELCRVVQLSISGTTLETDVAPVYDGNVPANFRCRTIAWLEQSSDPELRLPDYILPRYPVPIEGRVVSEQGATTDETYQFYPETLTQLPKYKVMIPLWANQVITTPFNPNTLPGQFYFPLYKYERVLVDLYFDRAMIRESREWRATAQLPLETQGDQLLLGKTPINRTSVQHTYENERPVFEIERLNQLDSELVKLAEGNLLLQVGTPPVGVMTGTVLGRKLVVPLGMPAVPPRGSPAMPGGLPMTSAAQRPATTTPQTRTGSASAPTSPVSTTPAAGPPSSAPPGRTT